MIKITQNFLDFLVRNSLIHNSNIGIGTVIKRIFEYAKPSPVIGIRVFKQIKIRHYKYDSKYVILLVIEREDIHWVCEILTDKLGTSWDIDEIGSYSAENIGYSLEYYLRDFRKLQNIAQEFKLS